MDNATPTTAEPLDAVATRLIACMDAVILALMDHHIAVETGTVFLLDQSDRPFSAPRSLDRIPVQMNFVGSVPAWADQVRYHLYVSILGQRRWSVFETPKGFNVSRIVSRILQQLDAQKCELSRQAQTDTDRALAEERLAQLGAAADVSQESPLRLRQDNLRVEGIPASPDEVLITLRTSHENAAKIATDYRIRSRRARIQ